MTAPTTCTHRATVAAFTYEEAQLLGGGVDVREAAWCDACGALFTLPTVGGLFGEVTS